MHYLHETEKTFEIRRQGDGGVSATYPKTFEGELAVEAHLKRLESLTAQEFTRSTYPRAMRWLGELRQEKVKYRRYRDAYVQRSSRRRNS